MPDKIVPTVQPSPVIALHPDSKAAGRPAGWPP
jgi:hypothetical protein